MTYRNSQNLFPAYKIPLIHNKTVAHNNVCAWGYYMQAIRVNLNVEVAVIPYESNLIIYESGWMPNLYWIILI